MHPNHRHVVVAKKFNHQKNGIYALERDVKNGQFTLPLWYGAGIDRSRGFGGRISRRSHPVSWFGFIAHIPPVDQWLKISNRLNVVR